jgi:TonB family protein
MSFHTVRRLFLVAVLVSATVQPIEMVASQKNDLPPQSNGATPTHPQVRAGLEMLSDTEGVDFNAYLREVYLSVKKRWFANMPPSVEKGQQGSNTVEFRVLRDGNVPKDYSRIVIRSEKSDFDAASLQAIREAAPFGHLPEKFSQPFIVLRITFYYNLSQKPQ